MLLLLRTRCSCSVFECNVLTYHYQPLNLCAALERKGHGLQWSLSSGEPTRNAQTLQGCVNHALFQQWLYCLLHGTRVLPPRLTHPFAFYFCTKIPMHNTEIMSSQLSVSCLCRDFRCRRNFPIKYSLLLRYSPTPHARYFVTCACLSFANNLS